MPNNQANRLFESAVGEILKATWEHYPDFASTLGLHQYDGRLPDISKAALSHRARELERGLEQLGQIDTTALTLQNYYDHRVLASALRKELFELTEIRTHETNPMTMVGHIELSNYIQRDYAPLSQRVEALTEALSAVPAFTGALRETMSRRLSKPMIEASVETYEGVVTFYDQDMVKAVQPLEDVELKRHFNEARGKASEAVSSFVEYLKSLEPQASRQFSIGARNFQSLLSYGEMVDMPLERLLEMGMADLQGNLARFRQIAHQIDPSRPPAEVVAEVASHHPSADSLIDQTRDMLEEMRKFLINNDIVSVPSEIRCHTVETPSFMRWAFAALSFPGPFEAKATETYYYVTPVEEDWSDEEKEQWLTAFNYATLRSVSVHEAYPGHYVHYLHTKNASSKISQIFGAYSFWEGWAHYTEQMMIEQGYGKQDPRNALGQLLEALLRDCRYICAIRMHGQGMTLDEATRFFMENAFMERLPAYKEALRGTFDPMYLNYTLGKLMILKLREDYRKEQGAAYSLKKFHDTFLSFGAPPIPLVREMMLRNAGSDVL